MKKIIKSQLKTKGYSLMETLIVIAIIVLVSSSLVVNLAKTRERASIESAKASIINAFEQARSRSATGVGTTTHGVHIEASQSKIISFEGDEYIAGLGIETGLPPSISVDSSTGTIIFDRINAKPQASTTITITHKSGAQKIIEINENGTISVQ